MMKYCASKAVFIIGLLGIFHLQFTFSKSNLNTLFMSQVIFRHGARNIDQTYPTDPYKNESFWIPGYSQLTNLGKFQGYNLGVFLRRRYNGFVKSTYDLKDIYIQSSDFARTIQTAYSVMAGFYLPNEILTNENDTVESYLSNSNKVEIPLPWKSVPVHSTPVEHDNLLRQQADFCPRYLQLFGDIIKDSEAVQRVFQENSDILEYFYNQTDAKNFMDALLSMDTLFTEEFHNITLPDWTKSLFATDKARKWFLFFFEYMTYTDEMKRLRVGPLLERLTKNMMMNETSLNEFDRARSGQKKIYFFSGHDATIAGLLNTLGIFDKKRPTFTSAIMIEVHWRRGTLSLQPEDKFVEIYYRNETDREPYQLEIPNCGLQCPLVDFIRLIDPYIPVNWNQECQPFSEPNYLSTGSTILILISVGMALLVLLQFWMRFKCVTLYNTKRSQDGYWNIS